LQDEIGSDEAGSAGNQDHVYSLSPGQGWRCQAGTHPLVQLCGEHLQTTSLHLQAVLEFLE